MRSAFEEVPLKEAVYGLRHDRSVSHAAKRRFYFHQRLQPEQPARAVADHLRIEPPACDLGLDGSRDGVGSDGEGRSVTGDEDAGAHIRLRAPSISESATSAVTRP